MDRASLPVREIASQVQALEVSKSDPAAPDTFRTIEKLSQRLSVPMGQGSFQAILARALARSTAEVPWLGELQVASLGKLDGLTGASTTRSADDIAEGEIVLLTHMLELLVSFIGPSLTLRFFREIWPQLSFDFSDFRNANDD